MDVIVGSNAFQITDMNKVEVVNKNTGERTDILGFSTNFGTVQAIKNDNGDQELCIIVKFLTEEFYEEIVLNGIKNYKVECSGIIYNYELEEYTHDVSIVSESPYIEIFDYRNDYFIANVVLGVEQNDVFSSVKVSVAPRN